MTDLGEKWYFSQHLVSGAMVGSMCDADLLVTEQPVPPAERSDSSARCALSPLGGSMGGGQRRKLGKGPQALGAILIGILQLPNRFWNNNPSFESSGRNYWSLMISPCSSGPSGPRPTVGGTRSSSLGATVGRAHFLKASSFFPPVVTPSVMSGTFL